MTQYNTWNVKYETQVTLNVSSNVIGDFNDDTNFPNTLLLIDTKIPRLCKAFCKWFIS